MFDGAMGEIREAGSNGHNCMLLSILFCLGFSKPGEAPILAAVMRRIVTLRLLLDLQFGRIIIHVLPGDNPGADEAQAAADLAASRAVGAAEMEDEVKLAMTGGFLGPTALQALCNSLGLTVQYAAKNDCKLGSHGAGRRCCGG